MTKPLRPIRNERDYSTALKEIETYFDHEPKRGSPAADRFDLLALIIEDYERRYWPVDAPYPITAIRYRMETGAFTQADFGRLFGSRQRASDILAGRLPLTMRMAHTLHLIWGIPAEALLTPPKAA